MEQVNVDGARDIAFASYEAGVPRFIHVSSLRANLRAFSQFSRTKAEGERMVRYFYPQSTIVRPATIFGPLDRFMNGIGRTKTPFV